jgi:hypothetical protein
MQPPTAKELATLTLSDLQMEAQLATLKPKRHLAHSRTFQNTSAKSLSVKQNLCSELLVNARKCGLPSVKQTLEKKAFSTKQILNFFSISASHRSVTCYVCRLHLNSLTYLTRTPTVCLTKMSKFWSSQ